MYNWHLGRRRLIATKILLDTRRIEKRMYVHYYLLVVNNNEESKRVQEQLKQLGDETINVIQVANSRRLRQWFKNNTSGISIRTYPSLVQVQLTCPKCEDECSCICEFDASNALSEDSQRYAKSVKLLSINTLPSLIESLKKKEEPLAQ